MSYPVGKVAGLAGITVRTLHHYDEIGLLSPSGRSPAGYRSYSDADLDRLQRILYYRELGFSLDVIATVVADPGTDAQSHLKRQRELLTERIEQLKRMVASVERAMEANAMGNALTPEEKFEVFGEFSEPEGYAEQAVKRWGDTAEWTAAQAVPASLSKQDWVDAEAGRREWVRRLTAVLDSGEAADSLTSMDLAEEHRAMLGRFMGECGYEMQRNVAEVYVTEPVQLSFLVRESEQRPGMAEFIRDAVVANATRAR
jgi:DNA-binding transcriptional MerR regulator